MAEVTALEPQKHDPERVSVFVDGAFAFGLSLRVATARDIRPGRTLTREEIEELQEEDAVERAYAAALHFLSFRPRSQSEVESSLRRKGFEPEVVAAVSQRLERAGYLNDREFAQYWIENRQTFRPRGSRALRAELRAKGLSNEVVSDALEDIGDEEELAYETGRTKLRSFARLDEREFFSKMVGFLARRGFDYAASSAAARRLYSKQLEGEE